MAYGLASPNILACALRSYIRLRGDGLCYFGTDVLPDLGTDLISAEAVQCLDIVLIQRNLVATAYLVKITSKSRGFLKPSLC